jgi:hypothetical protein
VIIPESGILSTGPSCGAAALEFCRKKSCVNDFNSLQIFSTTYRLFQQLTRNSALEAIPGPCFRWDGFRVTRGDETLTEGVSVRLRSILEAIRNRDLRSSPNHPSRIFNHLQMLD